MTRAVRHAKIAATAVRSSSGGAMEMKAWLRRLWERSTIKLFPLVTLAPTIGLLAACSGSETDANENPTAAVSNASETHSFDLGPFFHAETLMDQKMREAVGSNAGDSWARMMIEHHRGAIEMSKVFLEQNPTGEVAARARAMIAEQTREIADLQELLEDGQPDYDSAIIYGSAIARMHEAMMAIQGSAMSEIWIRKMIEHHRGAIAMTDVLLHRKGNSTDIQGQALRTRIEQQRDILLLAQMLRREQMATRQVPTGVRH